MIILFLGWFVARWARYMITYTPHLQSNDIYHNLVDIVDADDLSYDCQGIYVSSGRVLTARHCVWQRVVVWHDHTYHRVDFIQPGPNDQILLMAPSLITDPDWVDITMTHYRRWWLTIMSFSRDNLHMIDGLWVWSGQYILMSWFVKPGQSWSPVFDMQGNWIGMVSAQDYDDPLIVIHPLDIQYIDATIHTSWYDVWSIRTDTFLNSIEE